MFIKPNCDEQEIEIDYPSCSCGAPLDIEMRRFTNIGPRGGASVTVRPVAFCPAGCDDPIRR